MKAKLFVRALAIIMPLRKGHALVIPKKETDYIFDMEDSELAAMMIFAKEVSRKIKKVFPCRKIGVTVIGLEVPHAHIHMIPINGIADMKIALNTMSNREQPCARH